LKRARLITVPRHDPEPDTSQSASLNAEELIAA
jgi:hypothetical protein